MSAVFWPPAKRAPPLVTFDLEGRVDLSPPPSGYAPDTLYAPSYFRLVKCRTMCHDARTRFPEFYAYNFAPEEFHRQRTTYEPDPRVRRIGRTLRKLSLDEMPNLVVRTGRGHAPGRAASRGCRGLQHYSPEEMYKFACERGITGLAQINGRGLLSWGEVLARDLRYVRTRSVGLELKLILTTLQGPLFDAAHSDALRSPVARR